MRVKCMTKIIQFSHIFRDKFISNKGNSLPSSPSSCHYWHMYMQNERGQELFYIPSISVFSFPLFGHPSMNITSMLARMDGKTLLNYSFSYTPYPSYGMHTCGFLGVCICDCMRSFVGPFLLMNK